MRNPGGYGFLTQPDRSALRFDGLRCEAPAGISEIDTYTCFHCCRVTHVLPKMDPADLGGLCKICMKLICKYCVGKGCDPLEEKLRRSEERDRTLRSYGI